MQFVREFPVTVHRGVEPSGAIGEADLLDEAPPLERALRALDDGF
jgi:hypothetical protein